MRGSSSCCIVNGVALECCFEPGNDNSTPDALASLESTKKKVGGWEPIKGRCGEALVASLSVLSITHRKTHCSSFFSHSLSDRLCPCIETQWPTLGPQATWNVQHSRRPLSAQYPCKPTNHLCTQTYFSLRLSPLASLSHNKRRPLTCIANSLNLSYPLS